jgi:hypothetical protein
MPDNTTETSEATTDTVVEVGNPTDLSAEIDKWKSLSRKHEERAKANADAAKELDELKRSMLSDQEKAIEAVKIETRQQTMAEFAAKLVDAKLQVHLNGKALKADSVLSFNKSAFITETGDVDEDAIQAWVESNSQTIEPSYPDLGQGERSNPPTALNSDPLLAALKSKLGIN